jgi:uncharacterized protein CbrC (UPF0167 family)
MAELVKTTCSKCGNQTEVWCYTGKQKEEAEANECLCRGCGASQASHLNFLGLSCSSFDGAILRGNSPLTTPKTAADSKAAQVERVSLCSDNL